MKSGTPGAKNHSSPLQLHDPRLWVPWISIFEQGLRICILTSCLIQEIAALGLVQHWLFYQVSTSSVGQPASYHLFLCDGSQGCLMKLAHAFPISQIRHGQALASCRLRGPHRRTNCPPPPVTILVTWITG